MAMINGYFDASGDNACPDALTVGGYVSLAEFLFEPKIDGFRALAYVRGQQCELVSRNGHVFTSWPQLAADIARVVKAHNAILDGETCCLQSCGRSDFYSLLFRRDHPYFYAFDVLSVGGEDVCALRLIERKRRLRRIMPKVDTRLLYLDSIAERGRDLYRAAGRGSGQKSTLANPYLNIGFYHLHSLSFRFCPPQAKRQRANQFRSTRSLTLNEARNLRFVAVSIRHRRHER